MQSFLLSRDRGDTWDAISPDLTRGTATEKGDIPYHTLFALSESPLRFGLVYAGSDDGRAHVRKDGGKTWTDITAGLAPRRWVSRITASPYDLGTVYLTQNGKRDDDRTWTSLAAGVPLGPVNVVREDPRKREVLYLGTDLGVYISTDAGATW